MSVYKNIKYDNTKVQVDSAIRDKNGKNIVNNYQEKLIAGNGITIQNNVISSAGGGSSSYIMDTTDNLNNYIEKFDESSSKYSIRIKKDLLLCGVYLQNATGINSISFVEIESKEIRNINYTSTSNSGFYCFEYDLFNNANPAYTLKLSCKKDELTLSIFDSNRTEHILFKSNYSSNITTNNKLNSSDLIYPSGTLQGYMIYYKE